MNPERPISVLSFDPITLINRPAGFIFDLIESSRIGPRRSIEYDVNLPGERSDGGLSGHIRKNEVVIVGTQSGKSHPRFLALPAPVIFLQNQAGAVVGLSRERVGRAKRRLIVVGAYCLCSR